MKERLDVLLVRQGYAQSRERAKAIIMSGNVFVNGQREDKAGTAFDETKIRIEVKGNALKYVSRGGLKLEKAITAFKLCLQDKVCMDIGASTGGFTDCMLQNGAAKVYSVDVGCGQLDWKLRTDERVICMEKTNFRYMQPADIGDRLDFASVDVSFISLTKILLPARELLQPQGQMVCLIKPQFEAGKGKVGKKGVVREPEIHSEVIGKIVDFADLAGFAIAGLEYSPIKGPEGNIEYLLYLKKVLPISQPPSAPMAEQFEFPSLTEAEAEKRLKEIRTQESGLSQTEEMGKWIAQTVEAAHKALLKGDND